ncbi:hypothetical protein FOA52_003256 [Chlamydomonas sp. UWO 241]|nr:hypothetical protein FOA52_003256 [Chlamydomonas sp. UWO 241]
MIREGTAYKLTAASDVVVKRTIHLTCDSGGDFYTFHDYARTPEVKKTWFLSSLCYLEPASAEKISKKPQEVRIRPEGSWSISTTLKLVDSEPISLYCFRLQWPKRWAAKGYTSLELGFEDADDAREWHEAFNSAIQAKRAAAGLDSVTLADMVSNAGDPSPDNDGSTTTEYMAMGGTPRGASRHGLEGAIVEEGEGGEASFASAVAGGVEDGYAGGMREDEEAVQTKKAQTTNSRRWRTMAERWVPYKQTQGVAIYRLDEKSIKTCASNVPSAAMGGEYMVSTIVGGPAEAVRDALMTGSSHTTILGPANSVEVLRTDTGVDGEKKREVLRLVLEAEGWAGKLCAPREMLVERMLKSEEGMYMILFSSVDQAVTSTVSRPEACNKRTSLYTKPVRGWVRGTYVIAPMLGFSLKTSPECMVTCILKVDLGGWCGDKSFLRPMSHASGMVDAFLERILMSVLLVRNEVEASKFVLEWQKLIMPSSHEEELLDPDAPIFQPASGLSMAPSVLKGAATKGASVSSAASSAKSAMHVLGQSKLSMRVRPGGAGEAFVSVDEDGEVEACTMDMEKIRALSILPTSFWSELHAPGMPCVFDVRGPTYLKDRRKVGAGLSAFTLASIDFFKVPHKVDHVARYLPSVRTSGAPFAIVINVIIPGNPLLNLVANFVVDKHPDVLGSPPSNPQEDDQGWKPFDLVLHRFIHGTDAERSKMLKLIPRIADGSFLIRSAVGTKPVIIGKALPVVYTMTDTYIQCDIDVSANSTAAYATSMVRGAVGSLTVDMAFVLEGMSPFELPECLIGAMRLDHLNTGACPALDISQEIPLMRPRTSTGGV